MDNIDVSIIIVNYNTKLMTNECINSILNCTKNNLIEIILVDNASTDGSKEFFISDKRIKYIYSEDNLGFGKANNLGVSIANGKYVFLLNSDTILLDDVISKLFKFAEINNINNIGSIGTRLINQNLEDTLSFGQFTSPKRIYTRLLEKVKFKKNSYQSKIYAELQNKGFSKVDFVSGADLFILRNIYDDVEGFDPDFFMYYEETDLQKRISRLGYQSFIINCKDIIHLDGGSFQDKLPFKRKMLMTNGLKLYITKNFFGFNKFHMRVLSLLLLMIDLRKLSYSNKQNIALVNEILR
jgi:GT2 family glycosyltransferase